jgi:hypothetical protein
VGQTGGGDHGGIETQMGRACVGQREKANRDAVAHIIEGITAAKFKRR